MDDNDVATAAMNTIDDQVEVLKGTELDELDDAQLTELGRQAHALKAVLADIEYACDQQLRGRRTRLYETLGQDTAACCVRHRRPVRWISSPGWWIHDDDLPHRAGYVAGQRLSDPRSCPDLWGSPSPLVIIRRKDDQVIYPDQVRS